MQSVIDGILAPFTRFEDTLPPDVSPEETGAAFAAVAERFKAAAQSSERPLLINISGLPGAGKTFIARRLLQQKPNWVYISFDELMEALPAYRAEAAVNPETAFRRWEIPARFAGYSLLKECVERRLSILFEHSNANSAHLDLYRKIMTKGYEVEIRFIDAPPELVLPRVAARPRFFPPEGVTERWKLLRCLLPEYQKTVTRFSILGAWKK